MLPVSIFDTTRVFSNSKVLRFLVEVLHGRWDYASSNGTLLGELVIARHSRIHRGLNTSARHTKLLSAMNIRSFQSPAGSRIYHIDRNRY